MGSGKFLQAQVAYLASRHKDYCTVLNPNLDELGHTKNTLRWLIPDRTTLIATKIPTNIKSSEGREIDLRILNVLLAWLCDVLIEMEKQEKYKRIDPELRTMEKIFERVIEVLASRPTPFSKLQLLGMVSFLHYYHSKDFDYARYMSNDLYTVEEFKTELAWFEPYVSNTPKRFARNDFDYHAHVPRLDIEPTFKTDLLKCGNSRFVLIQLQIQPYALPLVPHDPHFNLLLYDREHNVVERFDPLLDTNVPYPDDEDALDNALIDVFYTNFGMDYLSPIDWCPIAIQKQQEQEVTKGNVKGKIKDFCQAWSLWYADLRLSNPNMSREEVIKLAIDELNSRPETLTEYIVAYSKNYEKYIINP